MSFRDGSMYGNEIDVIRNRKTYFAILAHINEEALAVQIRNIRHFNPDAGIIVYNGGTNPDFGKGLDVLLYPYSHPVSYGNLAPYLWEIMKWLEDTHVEYEHLINLDHDALFIKHGFQDYLRKLMKNHDVMGWDMVTTLTPADTVLSCCLDMWRDWAEWGPFFETEYFIRFLNCTQVYSHSIIRKMLEAVDYQDVSGRLAHSQVFALEEMFFVTLALSLGGRIREYPREENWHSIARFGLDQVSIKEVRLAGQHPYYYWIHPIKEEQLIRMNQWLMGEGGHEADVEPAEVPEVYPEAREAGDEQAPSLENPPYIAEGTTPLPAPAPSAEIPLSKKKKRTLRKRAILVKKFDRGKANRSISRKRKAAFKKGKTGYSQAKKRKHEQWRVSHERK